MQNIMKKFLMLFLVIGTGILLSACDYDADIFQTVSDQVDVEYDFAKNSPNEDDVLILPEPSNADNETVNKNGSYRLEFNETIQQWRWLSSLNFPNHLVILKNDYYSCSLQNCWGKTAFSSQIENYDSIVETLSGTTFTKYEYVLLQKNENREIEINWFKSDYSILTADEDDTNIVVWEEDLPLVLKLNQYHYINWQNYAEKNSVIEITKVIPAPRFDSFYVLDTKTNTHYQDKFYFYNLIRKLENSKNIEIEESLYDKISNNFSITFNGFDRESKPKISTKLSDKGDISTIWDKDNYVLELKNLRKNKDYKLNLSFEENGYSYNYIISFTTLDEFKISEQEQLQNEKKEYTNTYAMCFSQKIDKKSVLTALIDSLWEENFTFHKWGYSNNYGYGQTDVDYYGDECFAFTYFGNPNYDKKIVLKWITNLYGEKLDISLIIKKYVLSKNQSYLKLVWTPITTLPRTEWFHDTLQIISKNKDKWVVYYRECLPLQDFPDKIMNQFQTQKSNVDISRRFLACNKDIQSYSFDINNTERRKEKLNNIDLKQIFGDDIPDIIEIGLNKDLDTHPGNLYLRTNIGLFAKYSPKNLHIWANDMQSWEPIKNLAYTIGYYDSILKKFVINKWIIEDGYLHYEFPEDIEIWFFYGAKGNDHTFIILSAKNIYLSSKLNKYSRYYKNLFWINPYELGGSSYRFNQAKYHIFAVTDRVLYKPWSEDLFVSWRIRTPGRSIVSKGQLEVNLYNSKNQIIDSRTTDSLDSFGGFKTSFEIPKNAELGRYRVDCRFQPSDWWSEIRYNMYIQVQEFQKSIISIDSEMMNTNRKNILRITPKYYFGQYLKKYNVNLSYTLKPQIYPIWDWDRCEKQRCDNPIYYNMLDGQDKSGSWGFLQIKNYEWKYLDLDLDLESPGIANFNVDVTLTDDTTKEVVFKSLQKQLLPKFLIWVEGREYDWFNTDRKWDFEIKWRLLEKIRSDKKTLDNYELYKKNTKIDVKIYYKDFKNTQSIWPDWEYYYNNWESYKLYEDFKLSVNNGVFEKSIKLTDEGNYIVLMNYNGIYENIQHIYVYNSSYRWNYYYGQLDNNYKLNLFVKDKEYEVGENIEVNIEPYIKWATAIVTVEKEWEILLQNTIKLNGKPISIKAKKERYPNASISVLQVLWEDVNKKISPERVEPRFMAGYANIALSPSMMGINFDIVLTNENWLKQDYYYPGQKIKFTVKTKDVNGKALQTRLTVGIVDKALIDIYDQVRKPLERFYRYTAPGFQILSNYHIIFKILRVFDAENDSKWGWGGDSQDMWGPRKKFMDLAFWRGGTISNSNGVTTFETTLPDNLTTWVIDIIGLGKNWEMDTYRKYFTVNKDVIVNMYLPRFIAPYGTVRIPVSVISNKEVEDTDLHWAIRIGDYKKDIVIKTKNGESYFDLSIDDVPLQDILSNDSIKIYIAVGDYDSIIKYLPIRKENTFVNDFSFFEWAKINETIELDWTAKYAMITANISTLPISQISNVIKYLLHYPYWCTEQLLSSIYPTLIAKELSSKWYLETDIIKDWEINYKWSWKDITKVIDETLPKIYRNQQASGLFGYWNGSTNGNIRLSIYVYHVLTYMKTIGYEIDEDVYLKLEKALIDFPDPATHMDFLFQKTLAGQTVGLQKVDELLKKDNSLKNKIMAYTIYAYNQKNRTDLYPEIMKELKNYDGVWSAYGNHNILKSYFTRWLIHNWQRKEAFDYIKELLKDTDDRGIRWRSTQENMQILRTFADYLEWENDFQDPIDVKINLNWQVQNIQLWKQNSWDFISYKTVTRAVKDLDKVKFNLLSNKNLLSSLKIEYIPESPSDFISKSNNIKELSLEGTTLKELNSAKVGDIINLKWKFKINDTAEQVAVVYNIPVYSYIMNTIGKNWSNYDCWDCRFYYYDNNNASKNEIKFNKLNNTEDWYSCRPDYYEIRYDRLFLYYEHLPKNASCEVEFTIMKTHVGVTNVLSSNFFEMYMPNVRGIDFLK